MPYPPLSSSSPRSLEGSSGFGLSGLGTLKSQGKLGLSSLRVTLQTLVFFHESLELLPHLRHPRLLLLSLGALQGRTLFGLRNRLFQGRHLGRGSCNINVGPVIIMQPSISIYIYRRYYVPSLSSSCFLARPSSLSDCLRLSFKALTSAVSAAEVSSAACIPILTHFY